MGLASIFPSWFHFFPTPTHRIIEVNGSTELYVWTPDQINSRTQKFTREVRFRVARQQTKLIKRPSYLKLITAFSHAGKLFCPCWNGMDENRFKWNKMEKNAYWWILSEFSQDCHRNVQHLRNAKQSCYDAQKWSDTNAYFEKNRLKSIKNRF